ncbi:MULTISPECIES: HK97 family phage prohead protease [unclassified Novosphingobium]|uniref:HK97 family phage prohead protease n=1 Tax=unclassified Novosphingobium TaxID=2644732 RepID=UPI000EDC0CE9|nr:MULTISPECIES: HK97 family phage prohead protease [unclassified Novosphingobium]HCF24625.1 HK97 family phage prohead protease [Novosphingobium sp.]HQV04243.1 HK97 family phage prohead protease [Novosphingobium sp.]
MTPDQVRGSTSALRFAGYAALFGKRDAGRDLVQPGAFARTLAERREPLPLFWQHHPDQRIGWVETVAEDGRGLRVIATIDNPAGGAAAALKRGAVTGLSFGYRARQFTRHAAGRDLTDIDLFEVSLVTHPMQHGARVHLIK